MENLKKIIKNTDITGSETQDEKRFAMINFKFSDSEMLQSTQNSKSGSNTYLIISKNPPQKDSTEVIKFVDENGNEMDFTMEKFIEIFDNQGLSGFIM
ncbi:hypothetical protein IJ579_06565 [bacterium]|nr:hypothetical protein [bacterium]